MDDARDGTPPRRAVSPALFALPLLDAVLLAALLLFSIEEYGRLPEKIPTPVGVDGLQDRGSSAGILSWFAMPLMGLGITVFFLALQGLRRWSDRHPWLLSMPRRRLFQALPAEARERVLRGAFGFLWAFPVPILSFLIYGQWAILQVVHGRMDRLPWFNMAAFVASVLVVLVLFLVFLDTRIRKEAEAAGIPLDAAGAARK
jgi:hypothetical protein